jgi:hypothetical protein
MQHALNTRGKKTPEKKGYQGCNQHLDRCAPSKLLSRFWHLCWTHYSQAQGNAE